MVNKLSTGFIYYYLKRCHMDQQMYLFAEQIVTTAYDFLTAFYTVQITGQVFATA